MIFPGILLIGLGIFLLLYPVFANEKELVNRKQILMAFALIICGPVFILSEYLDHKGLMIFSILLLVGSLCLIIGADNYIINKNCTMKINATYLYSSASGKRGERAIPVFRYSYEGEEYTSRSQQTVFSGQIGSKYRTDQPCQIFINPDKPKINVVRIEKTMPEIAKIISGIALIAGGVVAIFFLK